MRDVYLSMPNQPRIFTVTILRSVFYFVTISVTLYLGIRNLEQNQLLMNVLNVISQLLLVSLFYFLIVVLKQINERRIIIISFILVPVFMIFSLADSLAFRHDRPDWVIVMLGILTMLAAINLPIQAFRIKKSLVSIYYKLFAINLFIVFWCKELRPVFLALAIPDDRSLYFKAYQVMSLINLALYLFIPVIILLMIQKLNEIFAAPTQQ